MQKKETGYTGNNADLMMKVRDINQLQQAATGLTGGFERICHGLGISSPSHGKA